ncbi:MAG TPA: hypothetical protein VGI81_28095, partial [Tepidisphaeraceae bacterium]
LKNRGVEPREVTVLTTVRDPLDHVVSIYHYWRQRGKPECEHVQAAKRLSFDQFVRFYVSSPIPDCRVYDELLFIDGGLPANAKPLRLEHWQNDLAGLGFPWASTIEPPRENTSQHGAAARYHGPETTRLVRERYAWAYEAGLYREPSKGWPEYASSVPIVTPD